MSSSNFCEIRLLSLKTDGSAGSKGVEIKDTAGGAVETSDEEQAGAEVRMVDLHQLHLSTRLPLIHTRMTASDFHPRSLRSRPPPLRASAPPALYSPSVLIHRESSSVTPTPHLTAVVTHFVHHPPHCCSLILRPSFMFIISYYSSSSSLIITPVQ